MSGAPSDSYLGGLFRTASAGNIARKFLHRQKMARSAPAAKPKKEREPRHIQSPKRDRVAELLSEGLEFGQIAERIGITRKAVKRHFENIRAALGSQAI